MYWHCLGFEHGSTALYEAHETDLHPSCGILPISCSPFVSRARNTVTVTSGSVPTRRWPLHVAAEEAWPSGSARWKSSRWSKTRRDCRLGSYAAEGGRVAVR